MNRQRALNSRFHPEIEDEDHEKRLHRSYSLPTVHNSQPSFLASHAPQPPSQYTHVQQLRHPLYGSSPQLLHIPRKPVPQTPPNRQQTVSYPLGAHLQGPLEHPPKHHDTSWTPTRPPLTPFNSRERYQNTSPSDDNFPSIPIHHKALTPQYPSEKQKHHSYSAPQSQSHSQAQLQIHHPSQARTQIPVSTASFSSLTPSCTLGRPPLPSPNHAPHTIITEYERSLAKAVAASILGKWIDEKTVQILLELQGPQMSVGEWERVRAVLERDERNGREGDAGTNLESLVRGLDELEKEKWRVR